MRPNTVRARLKAGATTYGIMAAEFFTPGFCQIAANAGAEFVIFDMEHGAVGIDILKAQLLRVRYLGTTVTGRTKRSMQEHKAIVNAIRNKDFDSASDLLKTHIRNVRDNVLHAL